MTVETHSGLTSLGVVLPEVPGLRTEARGVDPERLAALVPEAVARLVTDGGSIWAETAHGAVTARFSAHDDAAVQTVSDLARHATTRALVLALVQGRVMGVDGIIKEPVDVPVYGRDPRERIQELLAHANAGLEKRRDLDARLRQVQAVVGRQLSRRDLDDAARADLKALWTDVFAESAGPAPEPEPASSDLEGVVTPGASGLQDWPR